MSNGASGNGGGAGSSSGGGVTQSERTGILALLPVIVAIAALVFFAIQIYYMRSLTGAETPESQWGRSVYLFAGVEAIAFAAAGFLFGREVNRQRAEKAEARADKSQKDATDAKTTTADVLSKAKSLKELASLKAGGQTQKAARYGPLGAEAATVATQTATQADLEEVAELARRLFP